MTSMVWDYSERRRTIEAASLSEDDDIADFASAFKSTLEILAHTGNRGQINPPAPSQPVSCSTSADSVFAAIDQPFHDYVRLVEQYKNDEEIAACLQAAVDMDPFNPDSRSDPFASV